MRTRIKTGLLTFSVLLFIPFEILIAQWYVQESGTTADLRGLWFVDSLNGWACGDSGIVLHTTNGGQEWERQNSTVNVKLEDVFFWDLQKGWAVGDGGTVIHTTDGGNLWNEQQTPVTSLLHHIQFISPLTGFASGEQSTAMETFDGGLTWQTFADTGTASLILFWIQQGLGTITASDSASAIQHCTVDGLNWFPVGYVTNTSDICGVRAVFPTIVRNYYWDVGIDGIVWWISIIENYGVPEYILNGVTHDTLDLNAVTLEQGVEPLKLWAGGEKGWIICSVDSGQTWQTISSNTSVDIYEVSFPMKNRGWAVGDSGIILRYDHPTSVNNPSAEEFLPDFFVLDPYPNPFNSSVTILYSVSQSENISITIYNSLGQTVNHLFNGYQQRGNYRLKWDGTNKEGQVCSSDLYFVVLSVRQSQLSKKIIFLK